MKDVIKIFDRYLPSHRSDVIHGLLNMNSFSKGALRPTAGVVWETGGKEEEGLFCLTCSEFANFGKA